MDRVDPHASKPPSVRNGFAALPTLPRHLARTPTPSLARRRGARRRDCAAWAGPTTGRGAALLAGALDARGCCAGMDSEHAAVRLHVQCARLDTRQVGNHHKSLLILVDLHGRGDLALLRA